ncbi:hypothetical protein [Sulfuricystis multivorans]|uniref:hypothetical protein n=1 Tax=Sulfuricystis multivorans TaxID=2211108 RepID=UPI0015584406|nr:hypothetical protein [Sulfuricystis multivorans]
MIAVSSDIHPGLGGKRQWFAWWPLSHRTIAAALLVGLTTVFAALASAIHILIISIR